MQLAMGTWEKEKEVSVLKGRDNGQLMYFQNIYEIRLSPPMWIENEIISKFHKKNIMNHGLTWKKYEEHN